jgi:hypothetical protein
MCGIFETRIILAPFHSVACYSTVDGRLLTQPLPIASMLLIINFSIILNHKSAINVKLSNYIAGQYLLLFLC